MMSNQNSNTERVGQAWNHHREGRNDASIAAQSVEKIPKDIRRPSRYPLSTGPSIDMDMLKPGYELIPSCALAVVVLI